MHHPVNPVSWQEIAASYDPRGLPFLRYFAEHGLAGQSQAPARVLVQAPLPPRS